MSRIEALRFARVRGILGNAAGRPRKEQVFLTDIGAFYTIIPPKLAEELSIKAAAETSVTLADKRVVKAGVALAYIKLLDRDGVLPVAVLHAPEPRLGVTALEGLGLQVHPTTGKIEHSRPYGMAVL